MRTLFSTILLLILAPAALAQTTQPAARPISPLLIQGSAPVLTPTIDPPTSPGALARIMAARDPDIIREGTVLPECVGRLGRSADGRTEFRFESTDGRPIQVAPMPVLPNSQLMAMEAAVAASKSGDVKFRVTGIVTEYDAKNFVLLSEASQAPDAEIPATPAPAATTRPAVPAGPGSDVLGDLMAPKRPIAPRLPAVGGGPDTTTGKSAVAPGAPRLNTLRERTIIANRIARMTEGADGQMELTFESDGKNLLDPPIIILPNLKLTAMQLAVASRNQDLRFRITGTVTEYKGRNYILLQKALVVQDASLQF